MENKLRIVHVIPSLAKGGAERIVIDICHQLQNTPGVEVKLVVFSNLNEYASITQGLDVHVIPTSFIPSIFRKPINNTQALKQFFEEYKPHVIHTHLFEADIACRATEYYNAVYVTHCHANTEPYRKSGRAKYTNKKLIAWHYERRFVLKHAAQAKDNVFIAISTHTKDYFEHNLPEPFNQKVVMLLNAIDYKRFAFRPLPTYPETGRFKLINVGSFNERKNQKLLIEAMEILGHQSASAELVMLGDGAMRPEILTMIKKNGLELTVSAPGNVENVEEYLSNSHIYVHSALYEPFGLVIVEAMAAGLPVVAIDGYGNRDLHKEGETGYLIEYPSALRVAERIGKLISDKNLYNSYTSKARKFAAQFDIVDYTNKLVGIYSQYTGIQL